MQASDIPTKFPLTFAENAGALVRPIPTTTVDPTVASLDLGFPPATQTPVGAGGTPPDIRDMNGILNEVSAWCQWVQAGGAPVNYDSAFQASIGGYPLGAIVGSLTTAGRSWRSTTENNVTNPDTGGAGWVNTQTVGGALTGTLPNPTMAADVALPGNPTTTTQAMSNSSTRIATTAFANPGFLLAPGGGYQKLPSGWIIQCGTGVTVTGILDPITFPLAFPNAYVAGYAGEAGATGWSAGLFTAWGIAPGTAPLSGMRVCVMVISRNPDGTVVFNRTSGFGYNWWAIGY